VSTTLAFHLDMFLHEFLESVEFTICAEFLDFTAVFIDDQRRVRGDPVFSHKSVQQRSEIRVNEKLQGE